MQAPITSPAAIARKPAATASLALTRGSPRPPSGSLTASVSLLPAIMPTSIPAISGSSRTPLPSGVAAADVLEVLRSGEEQAEHGERHERHQQGAPPEAGHPE